MSSESWNSTGLLAANYREIKSGFGSPGIRFQIFPDAKDDSYHKTPHRSLVERYKGYVDFHGPSLWLNYFWWADTLRGYSMAKLTFSSDKLVAIGGISRHIKAIIDDAYIAGLGLRYFAGDLLW